MHRQIEDLMCSGKDWKLMLQSYLNCSLILFPEAFDKVLRLPNQDYCSPLCVQCVEFRNPSQS